MPNILNLGFNLDQPGAAIEFSKDGGATWAPLTIPTTGTAKTASLGSILKGTYAIGQLVLRPVGYPGSAVSNLTAVTVLNNVLATPTGTSAIGTSSGTINVVVNSIANQSGYRLLAGDTTTGPFTQLYQGTTASFPHTGLAAGQTKFYEWQYVGGVGTFYDDSAVSAVFSGVTSANTGPVTYDFTNNSDGFQYNVLNVLKPGYTSRSPFANFPVQTDHVSAVITWNMSNNATVEGDVDVYVNGVYYNTFIHQPAAAQYGQPQIITAPAMTLPAGSKRVEFRSANAIYQAGGVGYFDMPIVKVVLSGGTTSAVITDPRKAKRVVFLGDSIISFVGGVIPQLRTNAALVDWEIASVAAAGTYLSSRFPQPADRQILAAAIVSYLNAGGNATLKVLWDEDITNDWGNDASNIVGFKAIKSEIYDRIRLLDPTIRIIAQTSFWRSDQEIPKSGYLLEAFDQVVRDIAAVRPNYLTPNLPDAQEIIGRTNYLPENIQLHPTQTGMANIVVYYRDNLLAATPGTGTGVYQPPVIVRDYRFAGNLLDSSVNGLTLTNGGGTVNANGVVLLAGQTLSGAISALDDYSSGIEVRGRFQLYQPMPSYGNVFNLPGVLTVAYVKLTDTTVKLYASLYPSNGTSVAYAESASANVISGAVEFYAGWDLNTFSLSLAGGLPGTQAWSTAIPGTPTGQLLIGPSGGLGGTLFGLSFANKVSGVPVLVPVINTLSVASGFVESTLTLTGTNFGASQGISVVQFGTIKALVSSWSDTSIQVKVPAGASGTMNVGVVTNAAGSNLKPFTIVVFSGVYRNYPLTSGPQDISGFGLNLVAFGGGTPTYSAAGVQFNGGALSGLYNFRDSFPNGYTVECEVKFTQPFNGYEYPVKLGAAFGLLMAGTSGTSGKFYNETGNGTAGGVTTFDIVSVYHTIKSVWNRSAGTLSVFVDGNLENTVPLTALPDFSAAAFTLGNISGYLRNVKITN